MLPTYFSRQKCLPILTCINLGCSNVCHRPNIHTWCQFQPTCPYFGNSSLLSKETKHHLLLDRVWTAENSNPVVIVKDTWPVTLYRLLCSLFCPSDVSVYHFFLSLLPRHTDGGAVFSSFGWLRTNSATSWHLLVVPSEKWPTANGSELLWYDHDISNQCTLSQILANIWDFDNIMILWYYDDISKYQTIAHLDPDKYLIISLYYDIVMIYQCMKPQHI